MEARVSLENARGQRPAALLLRPDSAETCPVAVFDRGWGSGKASPRKRRIAEALVRDPLAALLIDFAGHFESEGNPDEVTLEDQEGDLRDARALRRLRERGHAG